MAYIRGRKPVENLGKIIEFELDSDRLIRRLVLTAQAPDELSVASAVGIKLANAKPGDLFEITVKGEAPLVGRVMSVGDELVNRSTSPALASAAA